MLLKRLLKVMFAIYLISETQNSFIFLWKLNLDKKINKAPFMGTLSTNWAGLYSMKPAIFMSIKWNYLMDILYHLLMKIAIAIDILLFKSAFSNFL